MIGSETITGVSFPALAQFLSPQIGYYTYTISVDLLGRSRLPFLDARQDYNSQNYGPTDILERGTPEPDSPLKVPQNWGI
jgi:hypothetical protein